MSPLVESLNFYLALGGVAALLFTIILLVDVRRERALLSVITAYGLWTTFALSLGATLSALVYSEVFNFTPCGLCWLERMFLFTQIPLTAAAIYFGDRLFPRYGMILSGIGFVIALYQHYLQMGGTEFVKCPVAGGADCAARFLFEFGFMTFPLLAASAFALLGALYYYLYKTR